MGGSAVNLGMNLAGAMQPSAYSAGQAELMKQLGAGARGLFSDNLKVNVNDPESLRAEAQRLATAGDMAGAKEMMAMAASVDTSARQGRTEARTIGAEQLAQRARWKKTKAETKATSQDSDKMLSDIQTRDRLTAEVKARGLPIVTEGLTNAEIARQINTAANKAPTAAALKEVFRVKQVAVLGDMMGETSDPKTKAYIKAQQTRVESGGNFDTAMTQTLDKLSETDKKYAGVIMSQNEARKLVANAALIDDRWDDVPDNMVRAAGSAIQNMAKKNSTMPLEDIYTAVLEQYYSKPEETRSWWEFWKEDEAVAEAAAVTAPTIDEVVARNL